MLISLYIIIFLLLVLPFQSINSSDDDEKLWKVARKEFARRTRTYLRENPISDELRNFIEELKQPRRRKRQDHKNMFAIKDGEVVPLEKVEENLNTQSNLGANFTVVPLIIPIPLENSITPKESTAGRDDSNNDGCSERAILGRGQALMDAKARKGEHENSGTEETVVDSLVEDKLKSTSESNEFSRVLEDMESLMNSQKKGKSSSKDGALCNVSGYWDSEAGGMTFYIQILEKGPDIRMQPTEPPSEEGFIPLEKWNVTARIPFPQLAQVIVTLTAHKGRKVAIFLGECRICDGSETITGDWLVGRTSSGCKDQKASHSFLSDVFRKNNVETLREAHMRKISNTTSTVSTIIPA